VTTDTSGPSGSSTIVAAYQGMPGAFSEEAARIMLGSSASLLPCRTLEDVFAALVDGRAHAAVVPVSNSIAGDVPRCRALIAHHTLRVVSEYDLPIAQTLLASRGATLSTVRRVYSHPVALAQCREFLSAHPALTPIVTFDTAGAVAEVIERGRPDEAAIGSARAAHVWGATILVQRIQDRADNCTRFVHVVPYGRLDADPVAMG
jgi:prephenate dehydratase